ncbi:agmatine deiminase family protein [Vibrio ostreicida]|uniref:Agmatine deiminase family protein n=1 Tax=Vibrio ostreicida TaxID=526588 RepID=A0ABT8BTD4_9VIBR|nr:agmatine deiminase family protein [Vibrio ostreicida]MDN3610421.1 agmatine deiminase family protein [Vibrio ostreicida]NPD07570.1 agmatine deiminase family protein [Vibrio ostreicida]
MKLESNSFTFRGEFEPQSAIWLGWPVYDVKAGLSTVPLYLEIIKTLVTHVDVNLAVQDLEEKKRVTDTLVEAGIDLARITLLCLPHNDIWFRDMGPIFLSNQHKQMLVNGFGFNGWSYESEHSTDIILDQNVARAASEQCRLEFRKTDLISEGGNREFNGQGVMVATLAVEQQRNPGMPLADIEHALIHAFNLEKIIWLDQGLYEDESAFNALLPGPDGVNNVMTCMTTGGHIDEFCRFVSADTLLLAEVSEYEVATNPIARENHRRLEKNLKILQQSTDQNGAPFHIIRMPMPEHMYLSLKPGDGVYDFYYRKYSEGFICPIGTEINAIAAASYCNFLITNNMILAPKYWKPGLSETIRQKDLEAHRVLQSAFPDREIHHFDVRPLNIGGGGIHCITQQQPFPLEQQ